MNWPRDADELDLRCIATAKLARGAFAPGGHCPVPACVRDGVAFHDLVEMADMASLLPIADADHFPIRTELD